MSLHPNRPVPTTVPGLAAVVAVSATVLTGAVLLLTGSGLATVASVAALVVLGRVAWRLSSAAALDVVVLAVLVYLSVAIGLLGLWPLPAAVAVIVGWVLSRRSSRAVLWGSWLRAGRMTAETPLLVVATVLITAAALLVWQQVFSGQLPEGYRDAALGRPNWLILAAGLGFAMVNAAVEEAIFRGVLQTSLEHLTGPAVAIVVQAAAFGLLHVVGVPTGLIGAVMAGSWGAVLGVLRYRTEGILAPYAAHVAADLTIVAMLLPELT